MNIKTTSVKYPVKDSELRKLVKLTMFYLLNGGQFLDPTHCHEFCEDGKEGVY